MIRFLVMDVDGTLTDGKIYMGVSGEAIKVFDIKDGCGIKDILPKYGIIPIIITARQSAMLERRCLELGITNLFQGVREKLVALEMIIKQYSDEEHQEYSLKNCAYIGDDILDLQCMNPIKEAGGIVGCPFDAVSEVKAIADYISPNRAGNGAVRDFISHIIMTKDDTTIDEKINRVLEYISELDLDKLKVGEYAIDEESYFMIQEYTTKNRNGCELESHKKYVDIQWILDGEEEIDTTGLIGLTVLNDYDQDKDVLFWEKPYRMQRNVLTEGSYMVLYPEDGHVPGIAVGEPKRVKKMIIKIRI